MPCPPERMMYRKVSDNRSIYTSASSFLFSRTSMASELSELKKKWGFIWLMSTSYLDRRFSVFSRSFSSVIRCWSTINS